MSQGILKAGRLPALRTIMGYSMRTIFAFLVATGLMVSNVYASTQPIAPLPAGKPAGAKEATLMGPNTLLFFLGAAIVIGGIIMVVGNPGGNVVTTPTTSSTNSLP